MTLSVDTVLAALDGSDESVEAARYAIAIAQRYDADVHLLYLIDHRFRQGIEAGDVLASEIAADQQAITATVREDLPESVRLTTSTAVGYSIDQLTHTPGSAILDAAEELDVDFLVVPRQTPRDGDDAVIGKAALYVIEYASPPVLSV